MCWTCATATAFKVFASCWTVRSVGARPGDQLCEGRHGRRKTDLRGQENGGGRCRVETSLSSDPEAGARRRDPHHAGGQPEALDPCARQGAGPFDLGP
ncbi:hypothetical protein G6F57_022165 [Rhizopus arrhizus]|nr:hypothetical protein G6F57_022165 [Rhizopus arrhizus]